MVQRAKERLSQEDYELLSAMSESILFLRQAFEEKRIKAKQLLRMLFGPFTEKASTILGKKTTAEVPEQGPQKEPAKRKGHGRRSAEEYPGARKVGVYHKELKPGQRCPGCLKGKICKARPGVLLRFVASVPIQATAYELEKLRCNLCGEVFTVPIPEEAGKQKYDETVGAMVGVLKYGNGLPFYRMEQLQDSMGIPLPASTQWEIVDRMATVIKPAYEELIQQAAQGQVIHNDDTTMKIFALMNLRDQRKLEEGEEDEDDERTGCFTSGFLSEIDGRRIALFFTGEHHAGENMETLLQKRKEEHGPPIQMCDALSRNLPKSFQTILGNCMSHARRHFVDVADDFFQECRHVIEILGKVYKNDEIARQQSMSGQQRLAFHQSESKPLMDELVLWLHEQFDQKKVEPNSGLGKAISYMLKRWQPLTLFLRVENAPLHNNICEQVLKKAVMHRKNSLFYRSFRGAYVGDELMSLIHTCNLAYVNPFEYLTALQLHQSELPDNPDLWMPWNYKTTIAASAALRGP
ncbi:MAG TPA: IS66 family transposase [Acidobacteriota bacterium]|nr:IS66 family transposase [Acidobacteriota bacterium]